MNEPPLEETCVIRDPWIFRRNKDDGTFVREELRSMTNLAVCSSIEEAYRKLEEVTKNIQENTVSRTAICASTLAKKELRCSMSNKCPRQKRDNMSGQFARKVESESESDDDVDDSGSTTVMNKKQGSLTKRSYTETLSWTECEARIVISILEMGTKPKPRCVCGQDYKFESWLVLHKKKCAVFKSFKASSGNLSCQKCGLSLQTQVCLDEHEACCNSHFNINLWCEKCRRLFKTKRQITSHKAICKADQPVQFIVIVKEIYDLHDHGGVGLCTNRDLSLPKEVVKEYRKLIGAHPCAATRRNAAQWISKQHPGLIMTMQQLYNLEHSLACTKEATYEADTCTEETAVFLSNLLLCSDVSFVFLGHNRKGLQFSIVKLLGSPSVLLLPGWDYECAFETVTNITTPKANLQSETICPQGDKLKLQQANPCDRDKRVHLSERNHFYYLDGASTYTIGVTELLRKTRKVPRFDRMAAAASSAKKKGVDKSEVLAEFEDATNDGITLHNNIKKEGCEHT